MNTTTKATIARRAVFCQFINSREQWPVASCQ
jgi:hypothetical protein